MLGGTEDAAWRTGPWESEEGLNRHGLVADPIGRGDVGVRCAFADQRSVVGRGGEVDARHCRRMTEARSVSPLVSRRRRGRSGCGAISPGGRDKGRCAPVCVMDARTRPQRLAPRQGQAGNPLRRDCSAVGAPDMPRQRSLGVRRRQPGAAVPQTRQRAHRDEFNDNARHHRRHPTSEGTRADRSAGGTTSPRTL